jgi:Ca-activated chloride channel family protein
MFVRTKRISRVVLGLCIAQLVFQGATIPAWGENGRQSQVQPQSQPAAPKNVTLSVTVLGKDGLPVRDLRQEDFRLLENGKEQGITTFDFGTQQPLVLGLLMQWSGQRHNTLPYGEIDPISHFFRNLMTKDDLSFAAMFAATTRTIVDFTNDPSEIDRPLLGATSVPYYGPTALFDSVTWACEEKLSTRPGRRVLLLVSDGRDNESKKSMGDAIESALRSRITTYVVSLARANPLLTNPPGRGEGIVNTHLGKYIHVTKELAEQTGGEAIIVRSQEDLVSAFSKIGQQLRSQYTIGYPSANEARGRSFQAVKVEVRRKGLRVLAPKGYYASEH